MSGIFFGGPPYEILNAWRHGRVGLVLSPEILEEYRKVGHRLAAKHPGVDVARFLTLVAVHSEVVFSQPLPESVCEDQTDDMFFACAVAAGCNLVVSGDKHLHRASGYSGIEVVKPRGFIEKHLSD